MTSFRTCLAILMLGLALPSAVAADETSRRDRAGDVNTRGLANAERKALDIVRVDVDASEFGLVEVTVRFAGNYERAAGRGRLRRSLVAIALRAKRGQRSTIVVTRGSGKREQTVGGRGPGTAFASLRDGKQLTFLVGGYPAEKLRRVDVATESRQPTRGGQARASATAYVLDWVVDVLFSEREYDDFASARAAFIRANSCEGLRERLEELLERDFSLEKEQERALRDGRRRTARSIQDTLNVLREEETRVRAEIAAKCGPSGTTPGPGPDLVIEGSARYLFFGSQPELAVDVMAKRPPASGARAAVSDNPVDAFKFTLPPASGAPRQVTDSFCSDPLPNREVVGDLLTCSGGTVPLGQPYTASIQMSPGPERDMGVQVSARQDGEFTQPVQVSGPERSCGFIFGASGASNLVLWQCSESHAAVRFDFNAPVTKNGESGNQNNCQVDAGDGSVIVCNVSQPAFSSYAFTVSGSCQGTSFTAQTTFAPGDVQAFPEKACS